MADGFGRPLLGGLSGLQRTGLKAGEKSRDLVFDDKEQLITVGAGERFDAINMMASYVDLNEAGVDADGKRISDNNEALGILRKVSFAREITDVKPDAKGDNLITYAYDDISARSLFDGSKEYLVTGGLIGSKQVRSSLWGQRGTFWKARL